MKIWNAEAMEEEKLTPFLFWLTDEPEDLERMTIEELASEIEKQEFHLLCREAEESGEGGTGKPVNWQEGMDSVTALLERLRDMLDQRILDALGLEVVEDEDTPLDFRDYHMTSWAYGGELKRAEDIVASWYLSDCFPFSMSGEKMLQVEAELKRQCAALEAEEPEPEDRYAHGLWKYRCEQRAEQLEQIRTDMWKQTLGEEEWIREESLGIQKAPGPALCLAPSREEEKENDHLRGN